MALETASFVANLVTSNPDGGDARNTADDHLRLIKAALVRTFPLLDGAVSLSAAVFMRLNDLSASVQLQLNQLRDGTATANAALTAKFANSANYALSASTAIFANSANYALSASTAIFANSANYALSASTALFANSASSAAFAKSASSAAELGGVAAAAFVQSGATDLISSTWSFVARPQFTGAGGFVSHANSVNNKGAITVTSVTPSAAAGSPGDIWLVF